MSSKKNKNSKPTAVQFEEILNFVQGFSYDAIGYVKSVENKPESLTKPKNLNAIRKDNLAKIIAKVAKIKGAIFADKQTQKADVENLYKLIAEKLGADSYKFDISFCVKFLAGYNSKNADKIDFSVRTILDNILRNAVEHLGALQVDITPLDANAIKEGKEADFGSGIKRILTAAVKEKCLCNEPKATKEQLVSTVYLALMLSNRNKFGFDKFIAVVERSIAEYVAEIEPKELSKNYIKAIPEALLDANPKIKVRSSIFLYFGIMDILAQFSKENERLSSELIDCKARVSNLISDVRGLTEAGENKERVIAEKEVNITDLGEQLTASRDRLEYEVNMYEKQLEGLKAGIYAKIRQDLQLELEGVGNIAKKLPPKEAEDLSRWIANIKQIVDTVGGKK